MLNSFPLSKFTNLCVLSVCLYVCHHFKCFCVVFNVYQSPIRLSLLASSLRFAAIYLERKKKKLKKTKIINLHSSTKFSDFKSFQYFYMHRSLNTTTCCIFLGVRTKGRELSLSQPIIPLKWVNVYKTGLYKVTFNILDVIQPWWLSGIMNSKFK